MVEGPSGAFSVADGRSAARDRRSGGGRPRRRGPPCPGWRDFRRRFAAFRTSPRVARRAPAVDPLGAVVDGPDLGVQDPGLDHRVTGHGRPEPRSRRRPAARRGRRPRPRAPGVAQGRRFVGPVGGMQGHGGSGERSWGGSDSEVRIRLLDPFEVDARRHERNSTSSVVRDEAGAGDSNVPRQEHGDHDRGTPRPGSRPRPTNRPDHA